MKRWFSFKNLIKRAPNTKIPIEFIGFGVGLIIIIILGNIAGNMYLQEQLFFEGVEKSVQIFTEKEIREFGDIYKDMSIEFQNDIASYIQDYANRTNRAGEKIHYGVFNHIHPKLNKERIKKHENRANTTFDDNDKISEIDDSYNDFPNIDEDTYIDSEEFKNGVAVKYIKTEGRNDGESNFQDILTVMSMVLDQKGTNDGTNSDNVNIKEKAPELLRKLFKMSHTFTGTTTQLYPCEKGCRVLFYYCNEEDSKYKDTGIDLTPFRINPHNDFEDYSEDDFEVHGANDECEVCGHNGKGCMEAGELCYHGNENGESGEGGESGGSEEGDGGEDYGPHFLGIGKKENYADKCSNIDEQNKCSHDCD